MRVFSKVDDLSPEYRHGVVAIGNFDGVHLGHHELLARCFALKKDRLGGVLSFSPHPSMLLRPEKGLFCLTSDAHKAELLLANGADFVINHSINHDFLRMSAQDFINHILISKLACADVVVGDDFCFGAQALGSVSDLARVAQTGAFKLHVVEGKNIGEERCSSSAIRKYLYEGNLVRAKAMLGRSFSLRGRVKPDQGIGRTLGFSTANITPPPHFALARGVYATFTRIDGQDYASATNVGVRPSVSMVPELKVETHCLDQELDLLDKNIEIIFIERIRDEIKFDSLNALKAQVQKDLVIIRQICVSAQY